METAREMIKNHGIEVALMIAKSDYEQAKERQDYVEANKASTVYTDINYIKFNK